MRDSSLFCEGDVIAPPRCVALIGMRSLVCERHNPSMRFVYSIVEALLSCGECRQGERLRPSTSVHVPPEVCPVSPFRQFHRAQAALRKTHGARCVARAAWYVCAGDRSAFGRAHGAVLHRVCDGRGRRRRGRAALRALRRLAHPLDARRANGAAAPARNAPAATACSFLAHRDAINRSRTETAATAAAKHLA
eukprot:5727517-Pleurochrysis_carterae.AAC.2